VHPRKRREGLLERELLKNEVIASELKKKNCRVANKKKLPKQILKITLTYIIMKILSTE
jgi:hypothetical protein